MNAVATLSLPPVRCPECGARIDARPITVPEGSGAPAAGGFDDCLRQCAPCGIGFSNGNTADVARLTKIRRDPYAHWPADVVDGCDAALAAAINETNRANKRTKFAFSTSEDHLTWTVFRYLQTTGALGRVFHRVGMLDTDENPHVLLWGTPVPATDRESGTVRSELVRISDNLHERPLRRSEPDVILWSASECVFIEIKYRSSNDRKPPTYANWQRYLGQPGFFRDTDKLLESEAYELARNWRIGSELAGDKTFRLVNLAPQQLFRSDRELLDRFAGALNRSEKRCFSELSWENLLTVLNPRPEWLNEYLKSRDLQSAAVH